MSKHDLRVRRTKLSLERAIMRLVQKKPLAKILILELTEEAMVSRQSFYKHYNSKEDLFISAAQNHIIGLNKRIKEILDSEEQIPQDEVMYIVAGVYVEDLDSLKVIMSIRNKDIVMSSFKEAITMILGHIIPDLEYQSEEIEIEILSGMIYSILKIYIENENNLPLEEIVRLQNNVFKNLSKIPVK